VLDVHLALEDQLPAGAGPVRLGVVALEGELADVPEPGLARLGREACASVAGADLRGRARPRLGGEGCGSGERQRGEQTERADGILLESTGLA
jgi:hypothetical protein